MAPPPPSPGYGLGRGSKKGGRGDLLEFEVKSLENYYYYYLLSCRRTLTLNTTHCLQADPRIFSQVQNLHTTLKFKTNFKVGGKCNPRRLWGVGNIVDDVIYRYMS